jgi:predicted transcriptional regulator
MAQIVRIGNTLAVALPEELLAETGLEAGDSVEWVVSDFGGLSLVPSADSAPDARAIPQEIPGAEDQAEVLAHIRAGLADFDDGRSVSHERVVAWLGSWGTEDELPTPECD